MPRASASLLRVVVSAAALLGALSVSMLALGQPSSAGAGPLGLPHPVSISAVHYGERPLKVLLVGDSLAGSLGVGLGDLAGAYNVRFANAGMPGCSLSMDGYIQLTYFIDAPGWPCVKGDPSHLLSTWQRWVDAFRPDVVLYVARGDLLDQEVKGRWTYVGHRYFNSWFLSRLRAGISVLSSRGAKVVLMTVPVSSQNTLRARPEDSPRRVWRDARLLRVSAVGHGDVSVYDLSALLTPRLTYRSSAQGIPLRCVDGVHVTAEAGMIVGADLYPRLWALAGSSRVAGGGGWVPGGFPVSTPRWWVRLHCT